MAWIQQNLFPVSVKGLPSTITKGSLERRPSLWVVNIEGALPQIKISVLCIYGFREKILAVALFNSEGEKTEAQRTSQGPCSAGLRSPVSTPGSRQWGLVPPLSYIRSPGGLLKSISTAEAFLDCFTCFASELTWIWKIPLVMTQGQSRTSYQGSLTELFKPMGSSWVSTGWCRVWYAL